MPYNPKYNKQKHEYRKANFKRVNIDFDKDYFNDVLKPAADNAGLPVNTFIKKLIHDKIDK